MDDPGINSSPTPTSLAAPITLPSGLRLPHRLVKAAMSEMLGDPAGCPTEPLCTLTRRFAAGGAALQITGNVMVDPAHRGEPRNVVADPRHLAAFSRWAASSSIPVLVQLNHPGRQSPKSLNKTPVAPSAVGLKKAGMFATPRAFTSDEVRGVIAQFARAAALMERAGFAGIQIHGAHGYLVSQFLSPLTNLRTDEWGGPLAHRARFLLETVRAIRSATQPGFTLAVKLNSADFQRGGFTPEEALAVARLLDDEHIDLLEISGGTFENPVMTGGTAHEPEAASTKAREAYFLSYAEGIRAVVGHTPLMLTGGFRTRAGMEAALNSGAVDLIGLGRPTAAEPDLPRHLLDGTAARAQPPFRPLGIKLFDQLLGIAWYQEQMKLMARGEEPRADLSRVKALVTKLCNLTLPRP